MSVKYTITPRQRDVAVITWIIVVIIMAGILIGIAHAELGTPLEAIKKKIENVVIPEVVEKIHLHIITIVIVLLIEIIAWGIGRKSVEEVTPEPGRRVA